MVESNPDEPTYTVISELTLTASRDDDNVMIACAVDHPSLSPGDKRSEQPLRVLCECCPPVGPTPPLHPPHTPNPPSPPGNSQALPFIRNTRPWLS